MSSGFFLLHYLYHVYKATGIFLGILSMLTNETLITVVWGRTIVSEFLK